MKSFTTNDKKKFFKQRAGVDGTENVFLHDNSDKSSNTLLNKALKAPSIHARAWKNFVSYIGRYH